MSETLFAKIVAGQLPCHRVYACPRTLGFLDLSPLSPGHTLVVPRTPAAHLADLPEADAEALGRALVRIAGALARWSGTRDLNVLQNNGVAAYQSVMHVHFHLIPRPADGGGLRLDWRPGRLDSAIGARQASALAALLDGPPAR